MTWDSERFRWVTDAWIFNAWNFSRTFATFSGISRCFPYKYLWGVNRNGLFTLIDEMTFIYLVEVLQLSDLRYRFILVIVAPSTATSDAVKGA